MKTNLRCLLMLLALSAGIHRAAAQAFILSSTPVVGGFPESVVAADFNGDGSVDLADVNDSDGTLTILTNNGGGIFTSNATYSLGGIAAQPVFVVAADVNNDGRMDLIGANSGNNTLLVLTNNGSGGFATSCVPHVGNTPYAVAAFTNVNGRVDLACANSLADTLTVLTNNGSGVFTSNATYNVGSGYQPQGVVAADVNGDGKMDLISVDYGFGKLSVLTNNGSGGFAIASAPAAGFRPIALTAADVNGDGKVDLIAANYGDGTLSVLTNNGSGGFTLSTNVPAGNLPDFVVAADINKDGKVDLIVANDSIGANGTVTVLTNNGVGGFILAYTLTAGHRPFSVAAADVNGDGKTDLIVANGSDNTLMVMTNNLVLTPPALSIAPFGNQVIVFYPFTGTNFTLQSVTNAASTNWVTASNGTVVYAVVFTNNTPAKFFRLH